MEIINIIILGFIQGVTEFLPISSSAHTIIFEKILNNPIDIPTEMVLNLGSLIAMLLLYKQFAIERIDSKSLWKIALAVLPTLVFAFIFKNQLEAKNFSIVLVAVFTICGTIVMASAEYFENKVQIISKENFSAKRYLTLGVFQSLSLLRGFSRSGTTISGGMLLGLSKADAVKTYLQVGIPVLAISCAYGLFGLYKKSSEISLNYPVLIIGFVVSLIFSLLTIQFILKYIPKHSFKIFIIYRLLLAFGLIAWAIFMHA